MGKNGWQYKGLSLLLAFLLITFAVPAVYAQNQSSPQNDDENLARTLLHDVAQLKDNPNSEGEVVGYDVYSLDRNQTLASHKKDVTFVPASVMKLLVTSTTVSLYPKDLQIPTKVYLKGQLTNGGVLQGDVVLKGYGDPTLTDKKLDQLAEALADHGVRRVQGNVVVDDHYFSGDKLGKGWMWDDESYYYSPQMSALSVNENAVEVKVKPTKVDQKPDISMSPARDYAKVINHAKTVNGKSASLSIERTRGKNEIVVSGTIGRDSKPYQDTATIKNPTLFTGTVFREQLQDHGISFHPGSKIKKGKVDSDAELVGTVNSPKLDDILRQMDKASDNFYAEMLTKQLGARERHEGTTKAGIKVIGDFVHNELGVDNNFMQKDGSGLTRLDHISPHDYIQLLRAMDRSQVRDRFLSFLPVAGVDGTLRNRMKGTPAEGNVTAKTGSMSGVNSIVGYVTGKNGERFAFSILVNGIYKSAYATQLQDKIAVALAKYPDLPKAEPTPPDKNDYPISGKLNPILDDPDYKGIMKGAVVYSVDRDKLLYARNPKSLLTPKASTKLLTTATALQKLGADYRFQTKVYKNGTLNGGVLHGDVIIKGYGDPTLATKDPIENLSGPTLNGIAKDLKESGIRRVQGNIIVDDSAFSDGVYPIGWRWDKESDPKQAEITALSVDQGTVRVNVQPGGSQNQPVNVNVAPKTGDIKVINQAKTGAAHSKDTLQVERERGTNQIHISGSLPEDANKVQMKVTVKQPQVHAGYVLQKQLEKQGVHFNPNSRVKIGEASTEAELVKTYHSPELAKIVRYQNQHNNNFTAEMVLKTLGMEVEGKSSGTFNGGINVVHDYMASLGIDGRFDMMDGSGQTRYNQMSAELLVSLLRAEKKQPTFDAFYNSLAITGKDGILRNNMIQTAAKHRLRGISGLHGITGDSPDLRGISGYVRTKDGELLAYSLLTGGASEQPLGQLIDRFGAELAKVPLDHVADLKEMVHHFDDIGAFEDNQAVHRLLMHLDAVIHYEQKGQADKVIKHLKGFKALLKHEKDHHMISDEAYETLKSATDSIIQKQQ